jgi:hypothetical protein
MYNKIMDFLGRFLGTKPVNTKLIFPDEPVAEKPVVATEVKNLEVTVVETKAPPKVETEPKVDMSKMTKAQVVAAAKEKGVTLNMKMKKNEMLAALNEN